jgi:hypothetical protein
MSKFKPILGNIEDWVEYNEESPTGLVWKQDIYKGKNQLFRKTGDIAGYLDKRTGYWFVQINKVSYLCHRVIYVLVYKLEPNFIDHLDGNRQNNRKENLRSCVRETNARNNTQRKDVKTGVQGVCYKSTKGRNYFVARVSIGSSRPSRYFNIDKLGEDFALKLAKQWREAKIKELIEQGFDYTERHGK